MPIDRGESRCEGVGGLNRHGLDEPPIVPIAPGLAAR
jgi:hypothetical protein